MRARPARKLPAVLSREEVRALLLQLHGVPSLVASLLYGSGLRLTEALRLRVKDLDFAAGQIAVRYAKGRRDRFTPLPQAVVPPLRAHLEHVRAVHQRDLAEGWGEAPLPASLARKYPNAGREWAWQFVFPASRRRAYPRTAAAARFHLHETAIQRSVRNAARRAASPSRPAATRCATASRRIC